MLGVKNKFKSKKGKVFDSLREVKSGSESSKSFKVSIAERLLVQINSGENEILFI